MKVSRENYEEASETLGWDVADLCFNGGERIRAVEKIKYPILLVFCSTFFVAMKLTYLDMLASSRLECGSKNLRHLR